MPMMPAPTAAPARPPSAQKPWKNDMLGLPRAISSSEAWVFMATSRAAIDAPKKKQQTKEQRRARREDRKQHQKRESEARDGGRQARTGPRNDGAGDRHEDDGADGEGEERQTQHRGVDAETRLDQRNVDRPDARPGPEHEEGDGDGNPGANQPVEARRGGGDVHFSQSLTRVPTAATMRPAEPARPRAKARLSSCAMKPRSGGATRKPL